MLDSRFVPSSAGELFGVEMALLQGISYYCALKICKSYFIWLKKTAKLHNQFVRENTVGTVKDPHPVSFICYKIIGMHSVSGNMK